MKQRESVLRYQQTEKGYRAMQNHEERAHRQLQKQLNNMLRIHF